MTAVVKLLNLLHDKVFMNGWMIQRYHTHEKYTASVLKLLSHLYLFKNFMNGDKLTAFTSTVTLFWFNKP